MPKFGELPEPNHWFALGSFFVCWFILCVLYFLLKDKYDD